MSFTVDRGETVVVVGESGCGKSLTALAIIGLLPPGVDVVGGARGFNGRDLTVVQRRGLRVGARPRHRLRVAERAGQPRSNAHCRQPSCAKSFAATRRCRDRAATARALELLEQVKFADPERVMKLYPHELSGGMAQRVAIAVAIAGRPELIVADEPTTALDVTLQSEILALLRDLQEPPGLAILLITHDWGVVADIGDRVVVMYAGEVVEQADVATAFKRPRFPVHRSTAGGQPKHRTRSASRLPTWPGVFPRPVRGPTGCRFADRCSVYHRRLHGRLAPVTGNRIGFAHPVRARHRARRAGGAAVMTAQTRRVPRRCRRRCWSSTTSRSDFAAAAANRCTSRSTASICASNADAPLAWSANRAQASRRWPELVLGLVPVMSGRVRFLGADITNLERRRAAGTGNDFAGGVPGPNAARSIRRIRWPGASPNRCAPRA